MHIHTPTIDIWRAHTTNLPPSLRVDSTQAQVSSGDCHAKFLVFPEIIPPLCNFLF